MNVSVCSINSEGLTWLSDEISARFGVASRSWQHPADLAGLVAPHEQQRFLAWLQQVAGRASGSHHDSFTTSDRYPGGVLDVYAAPAQSGQGRGEVHSVDDTHPCILTLILRDCDVQEQEFKEIVEQSAAGIYILQDGQFVYVNDKAAAVLGYTRAEATGLAIEKTVAEESRQVVFENVRKRMSGELSDIRYTFKALCKDGTKVDLEVHGRASRYRGRPAIIGVVVDISERKRTEHALERSEERYRRIVETAQEGIWLIDTQWVTTFVNSRMAEILGYEREAMIGRPVTEFMDAHGPQDMERNMRLQEQGPLHFEFRFVHRDGHIVWTSMVTNTIRDESGNAVASLAMVTDINERKQAEIALQESRRALEALISNVPGLVYRCQNDRRWTMEFVSEGAFALTGYRHEEMLGPDAVSLDEITDAAARDAIWNEVQTAVNAGEPYHLTYRLFTRDGNEKWVWERGTGVYASDGSLVALEGVIIDVTDRVTAEIERQKGEDQLRLALEASGMGLWDLDIDTNIVSWTGETARLLGNESLSNDLSVFFSFIHEADRPHVQAKMQASIDKGVPYNVEYRLHSPQRGVLWLHSKGEVLRDEDHRPLRMLGSLHDVTEKKHAEQTLLLAKERAEEASRLKNSILANLSHEIRTPMTAILGFSELLTMEISPGPQRRHAEIIHSGGRRLLHLLNSIIDLARLDAGRTELARIPHPLSLSVDMVVRLLSLQAERKGLTLVVEVDPDLLVDTDARAEEQVLTNLLNNAIRFTTSGSIHVTAQRETGADSEDRAVLEVRDTGIGISADFLPHIFDEFRQESEGFSRTHEGSGLGLSITRKLLERMNGDISITSRKGQGTTVRVSLPLASRGAVATQQDRASQPTMQYPLHQPESANIEILVIEDDRHCRLYFEEVLQPNRIVCAPTAEDGLEQARARRFDIVFMDINLKGGGLNGMEALQHLRTLPGYADTPVYALTAYAMKGDRERFLEAGFSGYLSKPFRGDEVQRIVAPLRTRASGTQA